NPMVCRDVGSISRLNVASPSSTRENGSMARIVELEDGGLDKETLSKMRAPVTTATPTHSIGRGRSSSPSTDRMTKSAIPPSIASRVRGPPVILRRWYLAGSRGPVARRPAFAHSGEKLTRLTQHPLALVATLHHLLRRFEEVLGAKVVLPIEALDCIEDLLRR